MSEPERARRRRWFWHWTDLYILCGVAFLLILTIGGTGLGNVVLCLLK